MTLHDYLINSALLRAAGEFVEYLEPDDVPFTTLLPSGAGWRVPDFCAKTKKEAVEPYFTHYAELVDIMAMVRPDTDDEGEWGEWHPSPAYTRLSRAANAIAQYAYQEVDNPAYDEGECLAWKEDNMRNFTRVEWGQSSPDLTPKKGAEYSK